MLILTRFECRIDTKLFLFLEGKPDENKDEVGDSEEKETPANCGRKKFRFNDLVSSPGQSEDETGKADGQT